MVLSVWHIHYNARVNSTLHRECAEYNKYQSRVGNLRAHANMKYACLRMGGTTNRLECCAVEFNLKKTLRTQNERVEMRVSHDGWESHAKLACYIVNPVVYSSTTEPTC